MAKYIDIFCCSVFVVIIPIALYLILKPIFKHDKTLNGIVNYDAFMRKFVFRIELNEQEFYARLKMRNINDSLEYYLSDDCTTIIFTKYNTKYQYQIMIDEFNEYIILKVAQVSLVSKQPYHINDFFIKKFNAVPLDYEKYPF